MATVSTKKGASLLELVHRSSASFALVVFGANGAPEDLSDVDAATLAISSKATGPAEFVATAPGGLAIVPGSSELVAAAPSPSQWAALPPGAYLVQANLRRGPGKWSPTVPAACVVLHAFAPEVDP